MIFLSSLRLLYGIYGNKYGNRKSNGAWNRRDVFTCHLNTSKISAFPGDPWMEGRLKIGGADWLLDYKSDRFFAASGDSFHRRSENM